MTTATEPALRRCALAAVFAALGAGLAAPALAVPLSLECHELIQGAPDPEGNRYVLDGDVLSNQVSGQTVFLSSSKLTRLSQTADGRSSWAVHQVQGPVVRRTVQWKDKAGRTVRTFTEVYDFAAKTVREAPDGADTCHHSGR